MGITIYSFNANILPKISYGVFEWDIVVTELQACDFVIKVFVIKMSVIFAGPYLFYSITESQERSTYMREIRLACEQTGREQMSQEDRSCFSSWGRQICYPQSIAYGTHRVSAGPSQHCHTMRSECQTTDDNALWTERWASRQAPDYLHKYL